MSWIAPRMGVVASVGITAVQVLTSLAVMVFFRRTPHNLSRWPTSFAPLLSAFALTYLLYQMIAHVELLVGSSGIWVALLPWYSPAAALLGIGLAYYLKFHRPAVYGRLDRLLGER